MVRVCQLLQLHLFRTHIFSLLTGLLFFARLQWKNFFFWGVLSEESFYSRFWIRVVVIQKTSATFKIRTHLYVQTHVSLKQLTWFLPSRSQSKSFIFSRDLLFQRNKFVFWSGLLMDQKCQKVVLLLICPDF